MTSPRRSRASVAVIAYGSADDLQRTLDALSEQTWPDFEVVIVEAGATEPACEIIAARSAAGEVKTTASDPSNLSGARNRGIAISAGDVVAFLAEGAAPLSGWLETRLAALAEPDVAGVGGDGEGAGEEATSTFLCTRFGDPAPAGVTESLDHAYPFATEFPWLSCADVAFRRDALVQAGGFDERFRGRLGELDLCCRLTDAGWRLRRLLDDGIGRSDASRRSDEMRTLRSPLADLSDRIRFPLVNGRDHHSLNAIFASTSARFAAWRAQIARRVDVHDLEESLLFAFDEACEAAWSAVLRDGSQMSSRRLVKAEADDAPPFTPFPRCAWRQRVPQVAASA